MKSIFLIGAGRSATDLIEYLLKNSVASNWKISIGEMDVSIAEAKIQNHPNAKAVFFDVANAELRQKYIAEHDLIISMLPAHMHANVAIDCVRLGKHMATASYVSDTMRKLDADAKSKGIILLNEAGLDPGIDHASAMKVIDEIKNQGGELLSFKSYCGGLVAPESNDNPWSYKFSWNPRNVVLAGQGTAQFVSEGKYKYIPYNRLFVTTEKVEVDEYGTFEAYANRDSVSYREIYGIEKIPTILRGTLRYPGYCKSWNIFVRLGMTDDSYVLNFPDHFTNRDFLEAFLPPGNDDVKMKLKQLMGNDASDKEIINIEWLGLLDVSPLEMKKGSPAAILQSILEPKWKLKSGDKDMIVMQHQFEYKLMSQHFRLTSSLVVKGENELHTAMSKTVGLPLAICVANILNGKIKGKGIQLPVTKEIYEPLLQELNQFGISFKEKVIKT